jgi:hypothetical protein
MPNDRLVQVACEEAERLVRSGVPRERACWIVAEALRSTLERTSGVGQFVLPTTTSPTEPEAFRKARETISPWLWILSVAGFGMAMLNTFRIKRIYGSWRKARTTA